MATFTFVGEKLTVFDIEEFEGKYELTLPANYKALILKYNGALVKGNDYFKVLQKLKY